MNKAKQKIIIIGAGQNGRVVANILSLNQGCQIAGFLDDEASPEETYLGPVRDFQKFLNDNPLFFISIGDNQIREKIYTQLSAAGVQFANAIHPAAVIEANVMLGTNVMIGALSYLNINASIGDGTFINNGCIIEHDNQIGRFCHLAPGVVTAGEVTVEDRVFIGINSTCRDRIRIRHDCLIGGGSNILDDTQPNSVHYGNPAKYIKPNS